MNDKDRKPFAAAMTTLFAVYGDELTPTILDAWWSIFHEHDLEAITQAMNGHVVDHKAGMFKPTPAHIIDRMEHAAIAMRRELAKLRTSMQERLRLVDDARYKASNDHTLGLISAERRDEILQNLDRDYRAIQRQPEYKPLHAHRLAIRQS